MEELGRHGLVGALPESEHSGTPPWYSVCRRRNSLGPFSRVHHLSRNFQYEVLKKLYKNERNEGGNRVKAGGKKWQDYGGSIKAGGGGGGGMVGGGEAMWTEQFVSELQQLNENELRSQVSLRTTSQDPSTGMLR